MRTLLICYEDGKKHSNKEKKQAKENLIDQIITNISHDSESLKNGLEYEI